MVLPLLPGPEFTKTITASNGTKITAFQGGWCPLSISNYTPMKISGQRYNSVLHYILCEKAKYFKDNQSYNAIKSARGASEQAKLGEAIIKGAVSGMPWDEAELRAMKVAMNEKLAQYPRIYKMLKATGDSILASCSEYDSYFGTGLDIDSEDMQNRSKWGKNIIGQTLMDFRLNGYDTFM